MVHIVIIDHMLAVQPYPMNYDCSCKLTYHLPAMLGHGSHLISFPLF